MFSAEDRPVRHRLRRRTALATAAAAVGLAIGFVLAHAAGDQLVVAGRHGWTAVPLGAVLTATAAGGAAAYALGCVAARTPAPRLTFTGLAAVGLLASSIPPLAAAQDLLTGLWLLGLHAVVAAALIPAVVPVLPQRRTRATAAVDRTPRDGVWASSEVTAGLVPLQDRP